MPRIRKEFFKTVERGGSNADRDATLRIIGGSMRGRKLLYSGDPRTRPMKDRVREAVFNLLGQGVRGKRAIDLFAGTGALGFEALSRGAAKATLIEQHFPTAQVVRQNAALLQVTDLCDVQSANVFVWAKRQTPTEGEPWVVFCSPPYAFYIERREEMVDLITTLWEEAPADSLFMVECDERFEIGSLAGANWDVRRYLPAVVNVASK